MHSLKTPKVIRIFALPSHQSMERTSGVDFARILQPLKHLDGYKDDEVEFKVTFYDIHENTKNTKYLFDIAKNHDIIFFNYLNNPWGFAHMGAYARHFGTKLIMDIDDALWNIRSDNAAQGVYKKGSQSLHDLTCICNEVDYITTTNKYLKNVIISNTAKKGDKVMVFPNYIDFDLYSLRAPFKDTGQITLLHYGSSTHYKDLENEEFNKGIDKIMAEYPNITLKMVGAFLPQYRKRWGQRYQNGFGHTDIYWWIKGKFREYMNETDILVVPLDDDIYNRSKSSIKFIEASSAKIPGIYQRIRQYEEVVEEGKNGMLASQDNEWYKAIKTLVDNASLRKSMGEEAFKTVESDWQMKDHVKEYADFFKRVLDN